MIIDVHGHCTPQAYLDALRHRERFPRARADGDTFMVEVADGVVYRADPLHRDLVLRLPALDALDVRRQLLSLSCPYGFELLDGAEAVDVAEATNTAILEMARPHGDRFVPLAVAPITTDGAGVMVLRRALAAGHRGMILSASVVASAPHDELLAPYLAALTETGALLLVHPGARVRTEGLPPVPLSLPVAGFQNELTVAMFRLLFGGLLDAVPDLRVICVNLGGAAPLLAERMRSTWEGRGGSGPPPDERFRRAYYDFSSFREHSLTAAVGVLGGDRIVLGTDYPIGTLERPVRVLDAVPLHEPVREAIRHGNATRLLG